MKPPLARVLEAVSIAGANKLIADMTEHAKNHVKTRDKRKSEVIERLDAIDAQLGILTRELREQRTPAPGNPPTTRKKSR